MPVGRLGPPHETLPTRPADVGADTGANGAEGALEMVEDVSGGLDRGEQAHAPSMPAGVGAPRWGSLRVEGTAGQGAGRGPIGGRSGHSPIPPRPPADEAGPVSLAQRGPGLCPAGQMGTKMSLHDNLMRDGLVRPLEGRVLGGVCAGLGRRFGLDPWAARLLFILGLMLIPGSQLLIYPILWILMPSEVRYAYYPPYPGPQYATPAPAPAQPQA